MRGILILMTGVLLASCDRPAEEKVPRHSDATMRQIAGEFPGMTRACLDKLKWGGVEAVPGKSDACYRFESARRWQGVWEHYMEHSTFCAAPALNCPDDPDRELWLEFSGAEPPEAGFPPGGTFAIEFIGRRNVGAGTFGHGGMFRNEVIVDRVISISRVSEKTVEKAKK